MSKVWQDFWTLMFLAASYPVTIVMCWRLMRRGDVAESVKMRAALVIFLWIFVIPLTLVSLGAVPELWRTATAPFAN